MTKEEDDLEEFPKTLAGELKEFFTPTEKQEQHPGMSIALKYDTDKIDWLLLPFIALEEVVKVFDFGAKKYSRGNYRHGFEQLRLLNASLRHILSHARGEDRDPESGEYHLAHAICCLLMLLTNLKEGKSTDNRKGNIV